MLFSQDLPAKPRHTYTLTLLHGQAMRCALWPKPGQARSDQVPVTVGLLCTSSSSDQSILCIESTDAQKLIKKKPWIVYFVGVLLKVNNDCPFVAWSANIHDTVQLSHHCCFMPISKSGISFLLLSTLCVHKIYCVLCVLVGRGAKNNMAGFGVVAIE